MATPAFALSQAFCNVFPVSKGNQFSSTGDKLFLGCMAADTIISITSLVLGILGSVAVIAMSAAAAYTLIGISGAITLLWIGMLLAMYFTEPKSV